ncbi:lipopolysaccharide biosynthesis protein [Pectobacterium versatile]|uniref:lipopolysaccharide biosynthesis protein n=1 Tax=Pectobacterium versatile TaxID=2488639 RepID=UPI00386DA7D2
MKYRLANVILRGVTLFSKFLMMFSIAIYIAPEEVGLYGLFFSAVMYMIYVVGFEFYTYSNREIASQDKKHWGVYIRDQMVFVTFLSVVVLPISVIIFYTNILPWDLFLFFYFILFVEYISQEINRFLISMSRQLKASIVLFFRSGLWPIIVVCVMYIYPESRNIYTIMYLWAMGGVGAIFIGIFYMRDSLQMPFSRPISYSWIISGVKVAIPLLVASLASKSFFTLDKFLIEFYSNLEVLAPYIFFASIASSISAFIDAAVIVFFYPKMVKAGSEGNIRKLVQMTKNLAVQILLIGGAGALVIIPFSLYILDYFNYGVYRTYLYFLFYMLCSVVVFCLSMSPHLALYALKEDKCIVLSNVFCFFFFILSSMIMGRYFSFNGVLISLLITCFILLFVKTYFLRCKLLRFRDI